MYINNDLRKIYIYQENDGTLFDFGIDDFNLDILNKYVDSGALVLSEFKDIKNNDSFLLVNSDGTIVRDESGIYFLVAIGSAYISESGFWEIECW